MTRPITERERERETLKERKRFREAKMKAIRYHDR